MAQDVATVIPLRPPELQGVLAPNPLASKLVTVSFAIPVTVVHVPPHGLYVANWANTPAKENKVIKSKDSLFIEPIWQQNWKGNVSCTGFQG